MVDLWKAIIKLMKVKTLVTLMLTVVFAIMCLTGKIETREFVTIFTVIISFYFGSQVEKNQYEKDKGE